MIVDTPLIPVATTAASLQLDKFIHCYVKGISVHVQCYDASGNPVTPTAGAISAAPQKIYKQTYETALTIDPTTTAGSTKDAEVNQLINMKFTVTAPITGAAFWKASVWLGN